MPRLPLPNVADRDSCFRVETLEIIEVVSDSMGVRPMIDVHSDPMDDMVSLIPADKGSGGVSACTGKDVSIGIGGCLCYGAR